MFTYEEIKDLDLDANFGIKRMKLNLKEMHSVSEAKPAGTIRLSRTGKGSISSTIENEQHPTVLQELIDNAYKVAREAAGGK